MHASRLGVLLHLCGKHERIFFIRSCGALSLRGSLGGPYCMLLRGRLAAQHLRASPSTRWVIDSGAFDQVEVCMAAATRASGVRDREPRSTRRPHPLSTVQ